MSLPTDPFFEYFIRPSLEVQKEDALSRAEKMLEKTRTVWQGEADQLARVAMMASTMSQLMRKVPADNIAEYVAALQERIFLMEDAMHRAGLEFEPMMHPEPEPKVCGLCGGNHETPDAAKDIIALFGRLAN